MMQMFLERTRLEHETYFSWTKKNWINPDLFIGFVIVHSSIKIDECVESVKNIFNISG